MASAPSEGDRAVPQASPPAQRGAGRAAWFSLGIVTLAHAAGSFSVLSVAPLSPFLVESLSLTRAQVGFLLPAVYLGGVLMALPSGWLTDRVGVRRILAGGLALIAAMVAIASTMDVLATLLACLVLGGFGFSVLNPASGKAVVDWFPPRRRGAAMGVKQTGLTLGGVAASLTLPPIAMMFGWRVALLAAGLLSAVIATFVATTYRRPPTAVVAAAPSMPRLSELGVYLRRPAVMLVLACGFVLSIAQSSLLGYLVLYTKETFALGAIGAAQLLALAQVGGTVARLAWGFLSDRYFASRRRPGIVLNAMMGAFAYALFSYGEGLPPAMLPVIALIAGAGAFGWVGLYFALVAEVGGQRHAGTLTGVAVTFSWSGVLVGPPLFGQLLELTGSYFVPWLVLAATALAVAVALPWPAPLVERETVPSAQGRD